MKNFKNIITEEIVKELGRLPNTDFELELSDIGNSIGYVIAKYFNDKDDGYDKQSFISGLNHGISLIDGTHDKPPKKIIFKMLEKYGRHRPLNKN